MGDEIQVELVAALPDRQVILTLHLASGATVAEALVRADLERHLPDFPVDPERIGIFGRACKPDQPLKDGDRVELYRPLTADPKEIRRQLAALEKNGRRSD